MEILLYLGIVVVILIGLAILRGQKKTHHALHLIQKHQLHIMDNLETLAAEVAETTTVQQSAIVLLQGLKAKLDAAGTDPVKLKALSDSLDSSNKALADAITANTPAEEPTPE